MCISASGMSNQSAPSRAQSSASTESNTTTQNASNSRPHVHVGRAIPGMLWGYVLQYQQYFLRLILNNVYNVTYHFRCCFEFLRSFSALQFASYKITKQEFKQECQFSNYE